MEQIADFSQIESLQENKVIVEDCTLDMVDSSIVFHGTGNVIIFSGKNPKKKVYLSRSKIECLGDNNLVFINTSDRGMSLIIRLGYGCNVFIGKGYSAVSPVCIFANEKTNVHIGFNCLFARDVFIRTSDMHMIYDLKTKKRINPNKDVFIGDHVWVGQGVHILKGAVIGSGSIIGDGALCTNDKIDKVNCVYIGSPAKKHREDIVWTIRGCNKTTEEELEQGVYDTIGAEDGFKDFYVFKQTDVNKSRKKFSKIREKETMEERIAFIRKYKRKRSKFLETKNAIDME